jgi:hypothetical protein
MAIFTNSGNGNGKAKWTRAQDELLVKLCNEGKGRKETGAAVGHPENSITYRIRFIKAAEGKLTEAGEEVTTLAQVLDSIKY